MGDQEHDPRRIVFIRWEQDSKKPDPELMAWLEGFISHLEEQGLLDGGWMENDPQEPSEIEQLEYLDSTVSGDHHPEALGWIMDAYNKHNGRQ